MKNVMAVSARYRWYWLLRVKRERLMLRFVWKLPRWLVYWCAIRLIANATTGEYGPTNVSELPVMEALGRWEKRRGGDPAHQ
jgi:hypothetical protein